jgi:hypothetical protein
MNEKAEEFWSKIIDKGTQEKVTATASSLLTGISGWYSRNIAPSKVDEEPPQGDVIFLGDSLEDLEIEPLKD